MKKIVIVNGIIAGLIVAAMFLITMGLYHNQGNFEGGIQDRALYHPHCINHLCGGLADRFLCFYTRFCR